MSTHLLSRRATSSIEPLENRIAPAVFYVSPNVPTLVHKDGNSTVETGDVSAATAAGSTLAIPLATGDTLVFDADNSGTISTGDTTLLKVTAGKALAFLTDFGDGAGSNMADLKFEKNELTGVAVSDKFAGVGSITTGPIITALDANGAFAAPNNVVTVQHASIASLTLADSIGTSLFAGGSISKVNAVSLGLLATGTATDGQTFSLNGGGKTLNAFFAQTANGEAGGSITAVTLTGSVVGFETGNGADIATGTAGAGGIINAISVPASASGFYVMTGHGGAATTKGLGGAGGSIAGDFTMIPATGANLLFLAGAGGASADGSGGAGGAIAKTTIHVNGPTGGVTLAAGRGGNGGNTGSGGAGGGLLLNDALFVQDLDTTLNVFGGNGGASGQNGGSGGAGGVLAGLQIKTQAIRNTATIQSGTGGAGFTKGGAGGAATVDFFSNGVIHNLVFNTGNGGDGLARAASGGSGGSLTTSALTLVSAGAITNTADAVSVFAGKGGNSPTGTAGVGGSVSKFTITNDDNITGKLTVSGGPGGSLTASDGKAHHAATGGALSSVSLKNVRGLAGFELVSGNGGSISAGSGISGNSGAVSMITVTNAAANTGAALIHSGTGGNFGAQLTGMAIGVGDGGSSGKVSAVTINDTFGATTAFEVYAGVPVIASAGPKTLFTMAGSGAGTRGGNIGDVSGVTLNKLAGSSPNSSFLIGRPDGAGLGGTGADSHGGKGGVITNISGLVGTLNILAPAGGSTADGNDNDVLGDGVGGAGGSVSKINVTTSGAGHFVHLIAAGDGGAGNFAGGVAGSVSSVKVAGDIGDVTKTFGLTTSASVMGGLVAGQRGAGGGLAVNGSITGIDVGTHTIAAILAGRPNASSIDVANAVTKISGIKAGALGADTGLTGNASDPGTKPGTTYDYNDGTGDGVFMPNNGLVVSSDTAIDGFVLVKTGGITLPAGLIPLLLLKV